MEGNNLVVSPLEAEQKPERTVELERLWNDPFCGGYAHNPHYLRAERTGRTASFNTLTRAHSSLFPSTNIRNSLALKRL